MFIAGSRRDMSRPPSKHAPRNTNWHGVFTCTEPKRGDCGCFITDKNKLKCYDFKVIVHSGVPRPAFSHCGLK